MLAMSDFENYIRESNMRRREHYIYNRIPVIIKDKHQLEETEFEEFLQQVEEIIPSQLMQNVEIMYIGEFPELADRNAVYADDAIYVTNKEPTVHDMLEDVIHEIAHSLDSVYGEKIYLNSGLEQEFLGKRKKLKSILDSEGYEFPEQYYLNLDYSKDFDYFLSTVVGYPTLLSLTMGLFVSPYAATSLQEYFANGFEKYHLGEAEALKKISPVLFGVIEEIRRESDN